MGRKRVPDISRRQFLRGSVTAVALPAAGALAGCQGLPFGPGANAAHYHAVGPTLDVDYDAVVDAARDTGYTVDGPYYVGTKDPSSGFHPTGVPELDDRFGPDFHVLGVTFFYTRHVFLELWFSADGTTVASLFDDRLAGNEFDITNLPPGEWLVPRLTLAFEMEEARARSYVEAFKDAINEGTDSPSVEIAESPAFPRTYESLMNDASSTTASDTYGDGWYEVTLLQGEERIGAVDFVVQSTKVILHRGERVYTIKLDRLGGFNLTIQLPPQDEIPEEAYRSVFREMFANIGLPPDVVDELTFEYTPTVW